MSPAGDKTVVCRDCGTEFVFTQGEQAFYAERGLREPTRCSSCRAARKASGSYGSSSYSEGERSSGTGSQGTRSRSSTSSSYTRSSERTQRQMYSVVCDDCGTTTEVPFQPREGRPVYCRDCYERRRGTR